MTPRPLALLPLAAWLAAAAGAAQPPAEWPTYHGGYGLTGVAETAPPDRPALRWRFEAGAPIELTPIAGGGRIYAATEKGTLFAIDRRGQSLWTASIGDDTFSAPPLYVEETVVAGTTNGTLHAFDAATGKARWRYDVGGALPGTANRVTLEGGKTGIVIVSQADGRIHGIELATGERRFETAEVERSDGSAGVAGGRIVMGSCAAALHVYSVEDGEKVADVALGEECQVAGGVAVDGDVAYAGTRKGKVFAVDVAAGKVLWTNADSRREAFTTPAVGAAHVVFGSDDGRIYALDRKTGKTVWTFDTEATPRSAVIAGNRVVVASGGTLFLLDLATGARVWSQAVSDALTSPAIAGDLVLVGADDGLLRAFGPERGADG